jgi:hypothetical protein
MKTYWGSDYIDQRFLSLRYRLEVGGQLHALAALSSEKEPPYPLDNWMDRPQSRCGRFGEVNNSCTYRGSNSDPLVVHPVASCYIDSTATG